MTEQPTILPFPVSPAQAARQHYRRYREAHPLPAGWTESISGDGGPHTPGEFRVLLESPTHFLDLQVSEVHEPGHAYAYLVRKDGHLPDGEEYDSIPAELLGTDTDPMPHAHVTVIFGIDGRPRDYHLAEPPFPAPTPADHLALEMTVRYPPEQ